MIVIIPTVCTYIEGIPIVHLLACTVHYLMYQKVLRLKLSGEPLLTNMQEIARIVPIDWRQIPTGNLSLKREESNGKLISKKTKESGN
jgi:hypothetical protein